MVKREQKTGSFLTNSAPDPARINKNEFVSQSRLPKRGLVKAVKKSKVKLKASKTNPKKMRKKEVSKTQKPVGKLLGEVSNYFEHVGVAAIKLSAELKVGDKIRVVGGEVDFEQDVKSMQIQHEVVQKAKKGDDIGIKIKEKVREGYKIFKV